MDKAIKIQYLGDVLGSLRYFGQCPCGSQHMSTHDRVAVVAGDTLCYRCAVARQNKKV